MHTVFRTLAAACLVAITSPAAAICTGASVDREYRTADVVVRAAVTAETRVTDDEPSPEYRARWGEYSPVMLHRLRVVEVFKGRPGPTINLFQEVNSGRFDVDMGTEYLLFLSYYTPSTRRPTAARGAMYVRFACGQSKPWRDVTRSARARLSAISRH